MSNHSPNMPLKTFDLVRLDQQYLWHPFTQMSEWMKEEPLIIARGDGPFLYDIRGNRYIDAVSSIWCAVHGHNHPHINAALQAQISQISHTTLLGLAHLPSIQIAEQLMPVLPKGLTRIFYADSGAGAVEAALKMAVQFWRRRGEKRTEFLALEGAYHGDTFGSVSVGYSETFHSCFQSMLFATHRVPPPYFYKPKNSTETETAEAEKKSLQQAERILKKHSRQIAACIVEPIVQGAAGIRPHSAGYLKQLHQLVKSHGLLFIADEVAVGFGRTGTLFAVEQAGISPDFLCLGKALSGGYLPLSATITTEEIFDAFQGRFEEFVQFFHGHTFSGNPLSCSAGLASLEVFRQEKTMERLQESIRLLWSFLERKILPHPHVMEIRGHGFFAGIEIGKTKTENYPVEFRAGKKIMQAARKHGILFRPLLDTVVLAPPLNIPKETLQELLNGTLEAIQEACP